MSNRLNPYAQVVPRATEAKVLSRPITMLFLRKWKKAWVLPTWGVVSFPYASKVGLKDSSENE